MELIEPLKKIGLDEKEAQVYLTLLRLNKATAYLVALRSGLKRTTVYATLDDLVTKGFALKMPSEKKTVYFAKSPQECFAQAREKISEAEDFLPKLTALRKENEQDGGVSYYEGIDQIKEVYGKLLEEVSNNECFGFYGHLKEVPEILRKLTRDLDKDYISQKIKRRVIIADTESTKDYIKNAHTLGVDVKPLSENLYDSNASIEVFKNKVIIFSHRDLKATLIENPDVAKVIKQLFEITWKTKQE